MNFARSYVAFAKVIGASTIRWHGGLLVDVTVEPTEPAGAYAITWALPSGVGAPREVEGRGVIRPDGFVAPLAVTLTRDYGRSQEVHMIDSITVPQR